MKLIVAFGALVFVFGGAALVWNLGWVLNYLGTGTVGYVNKAKSKQYHFMSGKKGVKFFQQDNWFSLGQWQMKVEDIDSFQVLAESYAKTDAQVFYRYEEIESSDVASFETLWGGYAKDTNQAYSHGLKLGPCECSDQNKMRLNDKDSSEMFLICSKKSIFY